MILTLLLSASSALAAKPLLHWALDMDSALRNARKHDRPVLVMFGATWCKSCRRMQRETMPHPKVREQLTKFTLLRRDIDRYSTDARELKVNSTPSLVALNAEGEEAYRIMGFLDADMLAVQLDVAYRRAMNEEDPANIEAPAVAYHIDDQHEPITWRRRGYRARGICQAHVGYGPLRLSSQSPFQTLRAGFLPRPPSTLTRGQFEMYASGTWANIWAYDPGNLFLDYETLQSRVSVNYGVMDTVTVELGYTNMSRFGGFMDGFIQWFHQTTGVDQGGRDTYPKEQFRLEIEPWYDEIGVSIPASRRGTYADRLHATIQHNITCGTEVLPAISWSGTLRYDLHSEDLINDEPWDFSLNVAASRRFGSVYLYLAGAYAWLGDDTFRGILIDTQQYFVLLGPEWRFADRWSAVMQVLVSSGVARWREPFSQMSTEVSAGVKWELVERTVLEFGLIENLIIHDNSPDFGLHFGITHRIRDKVTPVL